jgi:multidrug transporter EmrE-like cation transporter
MKTFIEFFNKIPVGVLLALSASSVIAGDYFSKYWSIHQRPLFYVLAMLGYLFSGIFYIPTLLREGLIITAIIWAIASTAGFIILGVFVFQESLSSVQIVGIILGTASLILLSLR